MALCQKYLLADGDGTFWRRSIMMDAVNALFAQGKIDHPGLHEAKALAAAHARREQPWHAYVSRLIHTVDREGVLVGVTVAAFLEACRAVQANVGGQVYVFSRELLAAAKSCGYRTVMISHSPQIAVEIFNAAWGFDHVHSATLPHADGVIQARPEGVPSKQEMLEGCYATFELDPDAPDSVAIGDTHSDVPLFAAVHWPLAFNPSSQLYAFARTHQVPIIQERKDVVTAFQSSAEQSKLMRFHEVALNEILPTDLANALRLRLEAVGYRMP